MSSKSVELANAIRDALNDADNEFVLQFEATRRAAPLTAVELQEAEGVQVTVFTGSTKAERVARNRYARTYKPVVAVQRLLATETPETTESLVDQLEQLVEEIETRLEAEDLADLSFVGFDEEQDREAYSAEAMQNLSFFATAITLEYTSG